MGAGHCTPFNPGQSDPTCTRSIMPGVFAPAVQCSFADAPAGDLFPEHLHVLSTPMVADLGVYWYGGASSGLEAVSFVAVLVLCAFAMFRIWRDQHHYV